MRIITILVITPVMTLDGWMRMTGTANTTLGGRLGVSGETIRRYRIGEREPDARTMAAIYDLTGHLVTPNDWVGVGPRSEGPSTECDAEQVTS